MADFLETKEWKKLSKKVRATHGRCLRCQSTNRLVADHVIPRKIRPDLELTEYNIQTLCWDCNTEKRAFYIVCFLENPKQELLDEIDKLKLQFQEEVLRYAERELTIKSLNELEQEIRNNPTIAENMIDNLEVKFNKLTSYPERVENPIGKTVSWVARYAALPIIMPTIVLLYVSKKARLTVKRALISKPSGGEISAHAVESWAAKVATSRFNDW